MKTLSSPIILIKKSIDTFFDKENLTKFLKVYVWLLPFQILFLGQNYFVETQSKISDTASMGQFFSDYPWFMVSVIILNVLFLIASFWVDATGIMTISGIVAKKSKSIKETFTASRKVLWLFSLLSILLAIVQIGGTMLLVVPGVIASVWFGFAKFIFITKHLGVIDSFKASKKLVNGRFFPILGRLLIFVIFGFVIQMVFTFVPFRIGSVISQFFGGLLLLPYYFLYKELSD